MIKTTIIFIVMFFLLAVSVVSQPPFQEAGGVDVLEIRIPQAEFIQRGISVQSNIHVHNRTTGLELLNTLVDCSLHLYNSTGHHIIELDYINRGTVDKQLNISGGNFSRIGRYSFEIGCNATPITQIDGQGGFVGGHFDVTESGFEEGRFMIPILIGIIAIMIFFGIIGYSTKSFSIKSFGYGISLIQLMNITFILYVAESGDSLIPILRINFWSMTILAFGIGMIGLIRWTIKLINPAEDDEEEKGKWER